MHSSPQTNEANRCLISWFPVGILKSGWNANREDVPAVPGTLLYRLRPERVTSSPEVIQTFKTLMQEGGGIEPHRADTRLTAYEADSTPTGLRLPHQVPMLFEGIGKREWPRPDSNWHLRA